MKTVILAAGMGRRMLPITEGIHKCLIEINGKPIIKHQLDEIAKLGIKDVLVVCGYRMDDLNKYLGNSVKYHFNPFYETTNSIVSVWLAKNLLNDDIVVINSDVIFEASIMDDLRRHPDDICVALSKKWEENKGYKVRLNGENVVEMAMEIAPDKVGGEYAGMTKISKNCLPVFVSALDDYMKEKKFGAWYEDAVVETINRGIKASYIAVDGKKWYEIDTSQELNEARKMLEGEKYGKKKITYGVGADAD